jgi:hypothetical protein
VILPTQTLSLGTTLTNFANLPLSPALNLFDPSLGTLTSVVVTHAATLDSSITSQNLSTSSSAVITASLSGSFQIVGLNQPIVQPSQTVTSVPQPAGVFGSSNDTVAFPPIQINSSGSATFTHPASIAFFTASPGRTEITTTMTATASGSASAPNGNLFTVVQTSASSTVSVTYTYLPTPCPTMESIGRIGVHHQQTQLIVTFSGVVNPTLAEDPTNYSAITKTGQRIRIKSATYHPATNSVTLIPAIRLNVHLRFLLSVMLPCAPGTPSETVLVPFGGKNSLIGFHNKRGESVVVRNTRIIGFYNHRGEFVAVHPIPLVREDRSVRRNEAAHPIHRNPLDFRRQDLLKLSQRGSRLDLNQVSGYGFPR